MKLKVRLLGLSVRPKKINLLSLKRGLAYSSTARSRWFGIGFSWLATALSTLVMFKFNTAPYNVNMVFMLMTLVATVWFGLGAGFVTAVLSFLCFNYFFIPPLFTFVVDAENGWLAIFLYFGTALLANQVAGRARLNNQIAQERALEATALYELASAVLTKVDQDEMLKLVLTKISQALGTSQCVLFLWHTGSNGSSQLIETSRINSALSEVVPNPVGAAGPDVALATAVFHNRQPHFLAAPDSVTGPLAYVPLAYGQASGGVIGLVGQPNANHVEFDQEERRIIEVFANHLALAVEHARLIREAAQVATLRDSDALKTALLDSVSHELRTPLTSIKTATANMQSVDIEWTTEERTEFLSLIEQETNRLTQLVSNILELSRIEGHALKPDWGWYYLPEIVEQVVGRLKYSPLLQQHPLSTIFAPNLPLARLDYLQIDQVLTNLIENAGKYSLAGRPITIEVSLAQAAVLPQLTGPPTEPGQVFLIKVTDEGRGIPPDELERVFDKFYRVRVNSNQLTMDAPGTGIGLAICKGIVLAHDGQIWAQNRLYGGSIFQFSLPLLAPPVELPAGLTE